MVSVKSKNTKLYLNFDLFANFKNSELLSLECIKTRNTNNKLPQVLTRVGLISLVWLNFSPSVVLLASLPLQQIYFALRKRRRWQQKITYHACDRQRKCILRQKWELDKTQKNLLAKDFFSPWP